MRIEWNRKTELGMCTSIYSVVILYSQFCIIVTDFQSKSNSCLWAISSVDLVIYQFHLKCDVEVLISIQDKQYHNFSLLFFFLPAGKHFSEEIEVPGIQKHFLACELHLILLLPFACHLKKWQDPLRSHTNSDFVAMS